MNDIKVFCPATVANISCGFDVLGLCLDDIGDEMIVRKTNSKKLSIVKIEGANLSLNITENVAGVAAQALLNELKSDQGFEIEIKKNIKAGSGIGSSAASSAGVVVAINELLGNPFTKNQLVSFAAQGEKLASGSAHADNVAPCIYGNFTLITNYSPLEIVNIPSPENLFVVILHPQIELKTIDSRNALPKEISLTLATTQWASLGGFIAALYLHNYELMKKNIKDVIAEPHRKKFIPHFEKLKEIALHNDAIGFGISGSGPSTFALCHTKTKAENVYKALNEFYKTTQIPYQIHLCSINKRGVYTIN